MNQFISKNLYRSFLLTYIQRLGQLWNKIPTSRLQTNLEFVMVHLHWTQLPDNFLAWTHQKVVSWICSKALVSRNNNSSNNLSHHEIISIDPFSSTNIPLSSNHHYLNHHFCNLCYSFFSRRSTRNVQFEKPKKAKRKGKKPKPISTGARNLSEKKKLFWLRLGLRLALTNNVQTGVSFWETIRNIFHE